MECLVRLVEAHRWDLFAQKKQKKRAGDVNPTHRKAQAGEEKNLATGIHTWVP